MPSMREGFNTQWFSHFSEPHLSTVTSYENSNEGYITGKH